MAEVGTIRVVHLGHVAVTTTSSILAGLRDAFQANEVSAVGIRARPRSI